MCMKKIFILVFLYLFISCSIDDLKMSLPDLWVSTSGSTVTIHNDSNITLDISYWKLVERLNPSPDVNYIIPSGTQISSGGTKIYNGSTLGFTLTCPGTPSIFLYDKTGKKIDDVSCL